MYLFHTLGFSVHICSLFFSFFFLVIVIDLFTRLVVKIVVGFGVFLCGVTGFHVEDLLVEICLGLSFDDYVWF